MFSENFYIGLEAGLLQKEAFIGKIVGGAVKGVGKGAWGLAKLPFTAKSESVKALSGSVLFGAPFAALGAHQYGSRMGRSTVKAYNPTRKNLMSPVTQKSPMGNIF